MMRPRPIPVWLGLLLGIGSAFAQGPSIEPPIADRPPDFSNIVGAYSITATAEPTDVYIEQPITLRIVITGSGPEKYEPKREDLRIFPAWDDDFYVQEIRDAQVAARAEKTWLFVYRLRPKHSKVDAIDGIKLVTYDPSIPGRKKFVTRFVDRIPITVKPKPETASDIDVPLTAVPDAFYQIAPAGDVLTPVPLTVMVEAGDLVLWLAIPPLLCLLASWAWRRSFPDEGQRKQRQRSFAAKRALTQLQGGTASAWSIVRLYLSDRLDFAVADPTPADVASFLNRRGFAKELCRQARAFIQSCDAVRFTPGAAPTAQLTEQAASLIHALEADPCVR